MPTATPQPLRTESTPSGSAPTERTAARPRQRRAPQVRIYTYPDCPDTKGVLAFLDAQQVPYVLDDLEGLPVNDDCGFVSPTVEVGRDTLVQPDCGDLERLLRSHGLITGRLAMPTNGDGLVCSMSNAA
ncbi:MAG: hypothetical protein AAF089_03195 [Bacteroidota bacterium]